VIEDLLPPLDELFVAAREERFVLPRCTACGTLRFPSRLRCPACGSTHTDWVPASGHGTIYSFVVVHQKLHPVFDDRIPYAVALVQLAEGPRMLALMLETEPAIVRVDAPVQVVFERLDDDLVVPRVRLA
jgi:uncharacterized protein